MRTANILDPASRRITVLAYGDSRSGKTEFAGTFPRPLFLSDGTENGFETLSFMDRNKWFEPGHPPEVHIIDTVDDMFAEVEGLKQRVAKKQGCPRCKFFKFGVPETVVVDSLTFWGDLLQKWLNETCAKAIEKNPWSLYVKIFEKMRDLVMSIHRLNLNVVWLCLATKGDDGVGHPLLPGQIAKKLPAACNLYVYQRAGSGKGQRAFEARTRPYGGFMAGGRYSLRLPDPIIPEYRVIQDVLRQLAETAGQPMPIEEVFEEEVVVEEAPVEAPVQESKQAARKVVGSR